MSFEVEHNVDATQAEIKFAEMEAKKNHLAQAFGWTREHFDEQLESVKEFLTLNEKKRNGKT